MSKRFIETDIFQKPFMRALEAPYKLLWFYVSCECDHAGIWLPEFDVASLRLGREYTREASLSAMKDTVVELKDGRWFLKDFPLTQYGDELNEENRVHASVIKRLERIDEIKPLISPLLGCKDKDKDKKKAKRGEKSEGGEWNPDPIQLRLNKLFGRRPTTKWDSKMLKAYKNEEFIEEDLQIVEQWHNASIPEDQDFRRMSLSTLLNNWGEEVDKAKRWKSAKSIPSQKTNGVQPRPLTHPDGF